MENEEVYRSFYENSGIVFMLTAPDGRVLAANPAACKLFERTEEEICRLGRGGLVDVSDPRLPGLLEQRQRTGQATGELTFIKKSGLKFEAEVSSSCFYNSKGERFTTMVVRDLTRQKEAEEKVMRLTGSLEEKVSQRTAEINAFYETAPTGLCILDRDLRFIRANRKFSEITGSPYQEIAGRSMTELIPRFAANAGPLFRKVFATGEPLTEMEIKGEKASGQAGAHTWLLQCYPLTDTVGEVWAINVVIEDITRRKDDQRQLKLLSRAVQQNPVSIIITDTGGNVEYVNPSFQKVTGYSPGEVKGENLRILKSGFHPPEFYRDLWETILAGREWAGEMLNRNKKGDLYWIRALISPILNSRGEITNFVSIREDITESKRLHEELVEAKERAEESDRLKTAFLSNVSHEIRTPMNGILGFAEILKEPGLSGLQQRKFLDIIQASGRRMLDTVNDLIDISRIETGQAKLTRTETDLYEQLETLMDFFKPRAESKGLQFVLKDPLPAGLPPVETDRAKLDSILTNLIKNAIKFSEKGRIEVGCLLREHYLEYYVRDTGIGVPPDRQEAIFKRFVQADLEDARSFQGSGLGLAISKAYAELLGGKIWMKSVEGEGSTFYFTIPLKEAPDTAIPNRAPAIGNHGIPPLHGKKILVAEDDSYSQEMIGYLLDRTGATLLMTSDGRETLEKLRRNKVDLIFLDIRMPEIDGHDVLREIRLNNVQTPVIAHTAHVRPDELKKFRDEGFADILTKPVARDNLYGLLNKYLA
jgi:PAS domain S-box-containing protein